MKLHLLLAALVAVAAIPLAQAAGDDVTVTLVVRSTVAGAPHAHNCLVTVPASSDVANVLDQAVADTCILQWGCSDFGFDCFVNSVDHVPGAPLFATYWALYVNGAYADTGVRGTAATQGSVYELEYEQGLLFPSPI